MSECNHNVANSSDVNPVIADLIGRFVMDLYHSGLISKEKGWLIEKQIARSKFQNFIKKEENTSIHKMYKLQYADMDFLLRKEKFLRYSPHRSLNYRINRNKLFSFRGELIEKIDKHRILSHSHLKGNIVDISLVSVEVNESKNDEGLDPALSAIQEVDPNSKHHFLSYEGTKKQTFFSNYQMTNTGCYICQENFASHVEFEKHVQKHGDETDFEILETYDKSDNPHISLSYQLCKNSQFFLFTLKTNSQNITIEKIIIVQSKSFSYIKSASVPYEMPESGSDTFYVDSNIFRIYVEQPIMIAYRYEGNIYIEQHHFLRHEEFPVSSIMLNPYRLTDKIKFKEKASLSSYIPTIQIRTALRNTDYLESLRNNCPHFDEYIKNNETLNANNICQVLRTLIQVDDMDTIFEYLQLAQSKVPLKKKQLDFTLKLQLPQRIAHSGLMISPYDEVIVIDEKDLYKYTTQDQLIDLLMQTYFELRVNNKLKFTHIGVIQDIFNKRIKVSMRSPIPNDALYMVFIRPSRIPIRYQHRTLDLLMSSKIFTKNFENILFPNEIQITSTRDKKSIEFYNKPVSENPEQKEAVENLVNITHINVPYIISGPPGTGKTTLLVEAILQLVLQNSDTKILITAGSNSACDEIANRLLKVISTVNQPHLFIRIFSKSCEDKQNEVEDTLLDYSNMYHSHFYPDIASLHQYRIIVCTLTVVGKLLTGGFGTNSDSGGIFTHVFVDEAAASTESEVLVGIVGIVTGKTRLILCGDHKQLRSVVKSKRAIDMGLDISLMERLLNRECYSIDANGGYNKSIQIHLIRNFRSHPKIVDLFSTLYYDKKLLAQSKNDVYVICQQWHRSPNKEYPIIFNSVFGTCSRDNNSSSFFNVTESEAVIDYVKELIYFGINGKLIKEEDIGIISPYKKQYLYIKEALKNLCFEKIEMGSVEYFQGREKEIIIVSFVRSFTKDLGFLDNPNRINVTISRAKSLLILIGNPKTLEKSADLKFIQEQCIEHGTRVGAAVYDDTNFVKSHNRIKNEMKHHPIVSDKNQRMHSNSDNSIETLDKLFSSLPKVPTGVKTENTKSVIDTKQIENDLKNLGISDQNTNSAGTKGKRNLKKNKKKYANKAVSAAKSNVAIKTQLFSKNAMMKLSSSHLNSKLLCELNPETSTSKLNIPNTKSQRSLTLGIGASHTTPINATTLPLSTSTTITSTISTPSSMFETGNSSSIHSTTSLLSNVSSIPHSSKISFATKTSPMPIQYNNSNAVDSKISFPTSTGPLVKELYSSAHTTTTHSIAHRPRIFYTTAAETPILYSNFATTSPRITCETHANTTASLYRTSLAHDNAYSLSSSASGVRISHANYTTPTIAVPSSYTYDTNVPNTNLQNNQNQSKKKTKCVIT